MAWKFPFFKKKNKEEVEETMTQDEKEIEEAKKEGKLRGAKRLELSVYNFNENAMGFYKKIGLTPLRTVMEVKI